LKINTNYLWVPVFIVASSVLIGCDNGFAPSEKGGVLSIKTNAFSKRSYSAFDVETVISNSLLENDPTTSAIKVTTSGNYIATVSVRTCTSGSSGYIGASVRLNGDEVANNVNSARECGSAVATVYLHVTKGDVISGMCQINQGVRSQCSFSLAKIAGG